MIIKNILGAAFFGLVAVWVAAPFASAQSVTTVQVTAADLNLKSEAGQATLRHRIRMAVDQVCGVADPRSLDDMQDYRACRQAALGQAMARARVQIAAKSGRETEFATR